jgi:peptide/nickel transport system ATP-binding protein
MVLLQVDSLSITYDTAKGPLQAVEQLSFTLDKGRSLGFVGESGCGKTTLGMALMGLLPRNGKISAGRILFEGEDLLAKSEEEKRAIRWGEIAMIFQAAMNALNPVHRVEDQIAEALLVHEPQLSKLEVRKRIEGLFQFVGLPKNRMRDFPHQYSGGMKQRAVIAMALACRPKLIIADEPTTALDVIVQDQILDEIRSLQQELGISLIFISHDISVVADICHDIGVMYAGHLVEYGPREKVFEEPAHPYTQALIASYPKLMGPRAELRPIAGEPPNLIKAPAGCRFRDRCPYGGPACEVGGIPNEEISSGHRVRCVRAVA